MRKLKLFCGQQTLSSTWTYPRRRHILQGSQQHLERKLERILWEGMTSRLVVMTLFIFPHLI